MFIIESQKSITDAIRTLIEKISLITSTPHSTSPNIYVGENNRNDVKVGEPGRSIIKTVERNEAGLITKIIENTSTDTN